jgi:hypothetical protein
MKLTTRQWFGAALALALCARSGPAPAAIIVIPVFDVNRWWEMYLMLRDVQRVTDQVFAAMTRLQNAAASLGGGNLVDDILLAQRRLTGDINAISYSVETVTTEFETVFPTSEAAQHISPSDAVALRQSWDREIHQSGLAAARAQSALSTVERNTASTQLILERSKATTGGTNDEGSQLAKLQAVVQMLGVINSDLTTLATTIATTERVNASIAAGDSSDEELERARAERMMRDYAGPSAIPDITGPFEH